MRRRASARLPVSVALACGAAALCACNGAPPAAPPAAAPARLVPPLHDAREGEELRMRRGDEDMIWRVASATDDLVEIEYRHVRGGTAVGETEHFQWPRNGFGIPPGYVIREIERDRIDVGGRGWDCWRIRAHSRSDVRHYWITEELPAAGFLRIARDDRGRPQLGFAADAVAEGSSFGN